MRSTILTAVLGLFTASLASAQNSDSCDPQNDNNNDATCSPAVPASTVTQIATVTGASVTTNTNTNTVLVSVSRATSVSVASSLVPVYTLATSAVTMVSSTVLTGLPSLSTGTTAVPINTQVIYSSSVYTTQTAPVHFTPLSSSTSSITLTTSTTTSHTTAVVAASGAAGSSTSTSRAGAMRTSLPAVAAVVGGVAAFVF